MVVLAFLSGLITTPAAVLGVLGGMWWWRRLRGRRPEAVYLTPYVPPPPPRPQDLPVGNRIARRSTGRSVRGRYLER